MSLWDRLTGEFIDVIDWPDDDGRRMVWRFERYDNAIKNGAKLTVREGQTAVFVSEGRIADVFGPGLYELETANLPILSTLQHWDHGFSSPFKAEVYFLSTRRFTDLKWGTKNPVMLRDPEFGPVRLRAYGTYALRVDDPATFLTEIVGVQRDYEPEEISGQIRTMIVSRFGAAIGASRIPVLDLAANYDDMGVFLRKRIAPEVAEYGLELVELRIENISLPPAVEAALDRRSQMGVIGDLRRYAQFQAAEAMRTAAENPSGGAGAGMGAALGVGMGVGMGGHWSQHAPSAPPPPPPAWHVAIDGAAAGPYDLAALGDMARRGALKPDGLVWRQGLSGWMRAGDATELAGLFAEAPPAAPPPLPPQG